MKLLYGTRHPVEDIEKAFSFVQASGGNAEKNADLRAGMLLLMVIQLAEQYPAYLHVALDDLSERFWSPYHDFEEYQDYNWGDKVSVP